MESCELTVIVPSRSEMFLKNTVEDILAHKEADTEIVITLDGAWANPPLTQHPSVNVIFVPVAIGQRAGQDIAARLARGKYIMKVDAHCSFDQGFDRKMLEAFKITGDNVTMVPVMNNLHAFNWLCRRCRWRLYQGPTPKECGRCKRTKYLVREMVWKSRRGVHSSAYCFDSEPHFQYHNEYKHQPKYIENKKTGFTETMSLQGSCFMATKEKYWELELGGEALGNWGNQGLQVACATWLSGGRCLVYHGTWYAHMFRTQGGDFSFPYDQSGRQVQKTKNAVRDLFWQKKHPKQIYPVSWLVEKFWPVPGWNDDALAKLKRESKKHKNMI